MARFLYCLILAFSMLPCLQGCGDGFGKSAHISAAEPEHEEMMLRMAHATEQAGDLSSAEHLFLQAGSSQKSSLQARLELADFYNRHNKSAIAIERLEDISKLYPEESAVKRSLANLYINTDQPGKALAVLDQAIEIDSKNALLYNSRGVALDKLGRYEEARQSYAKAVLLDPGNTTLFQTNLSMSYILAGSPNNAIQILLPLLNAPDTTPTVRQNLALAYGLAGRNEEAMQIGLKDLNANQAKENVKFYKMLSRNSSPKKSHPPMAKDVFPEEENEEKVSDVKPVPIPAQKITVSEPPKSMEPTPSSPPPSNMSQLAGVKPVDLPVPQLKPDPLTDRVHSSSPPVSSKEQFSFSGLPIPVLKPDN